MSYRMSPQVIFPTKQFSKMNTIVRFFTFFRVMNLQLIHDQEYELWNVSSGDLPDQTNFHNEYNCKVYLIRWVEFFRTSELLAWLPSWSESFRVIWRKCWVLDSRVGYGWVFLIYAVVLDTRHPHRCVSFPSFWLSISNVARLKKDSQVECWLTNCQTWISAQMIVDCQIGATLTLQASSLLVLPRTGVSMLEP